MTYYRNEIEEIFESYLNGNIGDTKTKLMKFSKFELMVFLDVAIERGLIQTNAESYKFFRKVCGMVEE